MNSRMMRRTVTLTALAALLGCSGARPRDLAGARRSRHDAAGEPAKGSMAASVPPDAPRRDVAMASPVAAGTRPKVIVRASARSLALDAKRLYFGDVIEDGVFMVPRIGGEPTRIARRAPTSAGLALDGENIAWVASPGDAVLRARIGGGSPTVLRDRGSFSSVATDDGEVFITEVIGPGGALLRVTGATASRIATFDGPPRGLVVDGSYAYVVTPTKIFRAPHAKGEVEAIASATGLDAPVLQGEHIYVIADGGGARSVARVAKAGGPLTTLATDVRDAPIAVFGGEVFYFDGARPQLRGVPVGGGKPRVLAEDEALASPSAVVADAEGVYVASGGRESAVVVQIATK